VLWDAVEDAVEATGKTAKRKGGKCPPQVMVYFVMGLALWAEEDYEDIWVQITKTLADWGCWEDGQARVTTGGITQARQRLGHEPVAKPETEGAFLGPWRKVSIDGLE
jgi:hypothetical protein